MEDKGRSNRFTWDNTDVVWPHRGQLGFGWIYQSLYVNFSNGEIGWDPRGLSARSYASNATGFMLPDWFLVLMFAGLAGLPWARRSFSLRTLLIVTTVVAIACAMATYSHLP
jgi:hypothetical protein